MLIYTLSLVLWLLEYKSINKSFAYCEVKAPPPPPAYPMLLLYQAITNLAITWYATHTLFIIM